MQRTQRFGSGLVLLLVAAVLQGCAVVRDDLLFKSEARAALGKDVADSWSKVETMKAVEVARANYTAIGTWAAFSAITAAVGPVIGGWLIDNHSWSWAFYVNAPLAFLTVVMAVLRVPESRNLRATGRLDWWGAMLVTLWLAGISYGLIEGPAQGWNSSVVVGALVLGAVSLLAFVWVERQVAQPMMPLGFFRDPVFTGANALTLLVYAALGGGLFFVPLVLIQVHGMPAAGAGAAFVPFVVIMFALSRWAGGLGDRLGPRLLLTIGPVISAAGYVALALPSSDASYWTGFLPGIVVLGLGMTITVAPLTTAVMNSAGVDSAGIASGINNAVSRAAGVLAIAALGALMAWAFDGALQANLHDAQVSGDVTAHVIGQRNRLAAIELPQGLPEAARAAARTAINDAFMWGYRLVMLASAVLCALGAVCSWLLLRSGGTGAEHERR